MYLLWIHFYLISNIILIVGKVKKKKWITVSQNTSHQKNKNAELLSKVSTTSKVFSFLFKS